MMMSQKAKNIIKELLMMSQMKKNIKSHGLKSLKEKKVLKNHDLKSLQSKGDGKIKYHQTPKIHPRTPLPQFILIEVCFLLAIY